MITVPLSDENRALVDRTLTDIQERLNMAAHPDLLGRILNACRLEERAKAEGEVEELKRWKAAAVGSREVRDAFVIELASNLSKAEARIAELTQEGEAWHGEFLEERSARMAANNREFAALSRATQAEELVREALEPTSRLVQMLAGASALNDTTMLTHAYNAAVELHARASAFSAKLKAAPLQGVAE